MDWVSFESRFKEELDGFCKKAIDDHPGESLYCVAIYMFYTDYRVIMLPMFSAATREWLASFGSAGRDDVRWSPADFPIQQEADREDADGFYRQACDWLTGLARAAEAGAGAADTDARHREWDA
ncbi:MAG: DUF4303 domain-containing protein, partial [Bifidobacteriaceae bacterium]|nr:DUF4303 domain-containing protein [Bifidobacteriaceae bacterium]